jgi:hypothetical protein
MIHRTLGSALLLGCFLLSGCTSSERYVEVMREQREAYQETVDVLVKVNDEKTMVEVKPSLDQLMVKFDKIASKAKALPKPSAAVLQEHENEQYLVKHAWERYREEVKRISQLKGGPEFLKQFDTNTFSLWQAVQQ